MKTTKEGSLLFVLSDEYKPLWIIDEDEVKLYDVRGVEIDKQKEYGEDRQ